MLVNSNLSWKFSVSEVWRPLCLYVAIAIIAALVNRFSPVFRFVAVPDMPITLLGAILGILLAFRINSSYGRWWEARTLWGALVNQSRSLGRQALCFICDAPGAQTAEAGRFGCQLVHLQIALVHALRCGLRGQPPWDDIAPFVSAPLLAKLKNESSVVTAILREMGELTVAAASARIFSEWRLHRIDTTLSEISNIQGGCERIKNTPLPRQYDFYPALFVNAYCVLVPICLVNELKLFTPLVTLLADFVMLVLNRLGEDLEDPFDNTVYDVPMLSLSRTIEINLRQMLEEQNLPPAVQAVNGVLW